MTFSCERCGKLLQYTGTLEGDLVSLGIDNAQITSGTTSVLFWQWYARLLSQIVLQGCKHSTLSVPLLKGALPEASLGTSHLSPESCEFLPSVGWWLLLLQDVTSAEVRVSKFCKSLHLCVHLVTVNM